MARLLTGSKNNSRFYKDKVHTAECKQAAGWGENGEEMEGRWASGLWAKIMEMNGKKWEKKAGKGPKGGRNGQEMGRKEREREKKWREMGRKGEKKVGRPEQSSQS